jgi:holliday junction DNA helicase RuvA
MIRSLEGTIAAYTDTSVVINVQGIGYLVHTNALKQNYMVGEQAYLHTHLAVRETALDLYGFREARELECFELLLSVPKIGPKSALSILIQADPDLIATAVVMQDAEHLHKVSGIGKKTAANIVTALTGKIDAATATISPDLSLSPQLTTAQTDAIDALITLGYEQKEARSLVLKLEAGLPAKDLIHAALKQSGRH